MYIYYNKIRLPHKALTYHQNDLRRHQYLFPQLTTLQEMFLHFAEVVNGDTEIRVAEHCSWLSRAKIDEKNVFV